MDTPFGAYLNIDNFASKLQIDYLYRPVLKIIYKIDWQKNEKLIKKAARDAAIKDLGSALENVDLEKVKNVALDVLATTRDVVKNVDWEAVTRAGQRMFDVTNKIMEEIFDQIKDNWIDIVPEKKSKYLFGSSVIGYFLNV